MKPKNLIPLVVVLVVLVGLVVLKKTSVTEVTMEEQVGLVTLLPEGLEKDDIARLELYAGDAPDDKLVLAFNGDSDQWQVASHYGSAAKTDVVKDYIEDILRIKGEPRATAQTDSELEAYELADKQAFHVQAFKKDATEPEFHLLVGKAPGRNSVFIRTAGSNEIFVEETDLRQQAGVYPTPAVAESDSPDSVTRPEPGMWLDKKIVNLDMEKINKVALNMPDKSAVFERFEKPKPEDAATEGNESDQSDTPAPAGPPEYEWRVASGGPGIPMKSTGLRPMLQKLSFFEATDIADPANKSEWGLDNPAYSAVISIEGEEDVRLEAGRPDPAGDAYLMVAGSGNETIYKVSKYIFEQVFPKGTDVFDIAGIALDKNAIEKIEISQPEGNVTIVKDGDGFTVTEPAVALETQAGKAQTLAQTLALWKPADYADEIQNLGEPAKTVTVTAGGQTHTIRVYGPSKHVDGSYARLDNNPALLVMSSMDADKIFVKPGDFYSRTLLNIDDMDITGISVSSAAGEYELTRGGDTEWNVTANGSTVPALPDAVQELAGEVSILQADEILFGREAVEGPTETLRLTTGSGDKHVVTVGPSKDGKHEIQVSGLSPVFTVSEATRNALFPELNSLKQPEPATQAALAEPAAQAEMPAAQAEMPAESEDAKEAAADVPSIEAVTALPEQAAVIEVQPGNNQ